MTKLHAKTVALQLRQEGHSYNHIAPQVGVSKSTLSVWLANVPYIPNKETIKRIGKARAASGAAKSLLKRQAIQHARDEALQEMGKISSRDLFMLGLGLYIGEGAKLTLYICLVNSDPRVIRLTVRWLVKACQVPARHIRLRLHIYPDCDEEASLRYWSHQTGIPRTQFMKTLWDTRNDKKSIKVGKLPHGTAHLTVVGMGDGRFASFLKRKVDAWIEKVLG